MAGYVQRTGVSEGILDDLCLQALSLHNGDEWLVLLSLDVVHVDEDFGNRIAERLGLPPANVVVAATHTHSGPQLMQDRDELLANASQDTVPLREMWIRQAVGACQWAMRTARPASMAWGVTTVSEVGGNRNNPDAPVDRDLSVVSFRDARNDAPLAAIVNYACHPTVLGAANLLFSTDFVGPLRRALGGDAAAYVASPDRPVILFLNGAAGDVSTRFNRRSQSHDEAIRLGRAVAVTAKSARLAPVPATMDWTFTARLHEVALQRRGLPEEHVARAMAKEAEAAYHRAVAAGLDAGSVRIARTRFEGALRQARMSANEHRRDALAPRPFSVRLWTLGPCAVVAVPAELFSSLGRRIKGNGSVPLILLAGYSNGYVGYIPDAAEYDGDSYEALSTVFERGQGEALCDLINLDLQQAAACVDQSNTTVLLP